MRCQQRIGQGAISDPMICPQRLGRPAREAVAIGVETQRRHTHDAVADPNTRRIGHHRSLRDPDHGAGDIPGSGLIGIGHLRGLTADQRDSRCAARLRHPGDERRQGRRLETFRGDIVEKGDGARVEHGHVIDAVVDQIATGRVRLAPLDGEVKLRADPIHAAHEHGIGVAGRDGERGPERAEAGHDEVSPGGLDGRADALFHAR